MYERNPHTKCRRAQLASSLSKLTKKFRVIPGSQDDRRTRRRRASSTSGGSSGSMHTRRRGDSRRGTCRSRSRRARGSSGRRIALGREPSRTTDGTLKSLTSKTSRGTLEPLRLGCPHRTVKYGAATDPRRKYLGGELGTRSRRHRRIQNPPQRTPGSGQSRNGTRKHLRGCRSEGWPMAR